MIPDDYELRGLLGQGGMSVVHRACDLRWNREVALKVSRGAAVKALLNEAKVLQRLRHVGIPAVYAFGADSAGIEKIEPMEAGRTNCESASLCADDEAWMAMELAPGESLEVFVSRSVLSEGAFVLFAQRVLEALGAAHEQGVLHLDLKPENIFIDCTVKGEMHVKILDFGCAQPAGAGLAVETWAQPVFGSLFYMAPERFDRLPCNERSDLYSLGCIFYFALSGQPPFQGDTAPQVMVAHLRHLHMPLHERRPDLDSSLADWVERLMRRDPADRPTSASAALAALHLKQRPATE